MDLHRLILLNSEFKQFRTLLMKFSLLVAAVITKICQHILASKSSSYQEKYAIVSPVILFITTLIPVYWTWANDDLRRFTKRGDLKASTEA